MTQNILFLLCRNRVILKVNGLDGLLFLFLHKYCSPITASHPHFCLFSYFILHTSQCLFPRLLFSPLLYLIKLNEECCDMMYHLQSPQSFLHTKVCSSHAFPLITSCGAITCANACGFVSLMENCCSVICQTSLVSQTVLCCLIDKLS